MDSCNKHGNVQCRFFCTTCSVPVCHVCMERGNHVIPDHQCIPLSQYCEKKSNEIRSVLHTATQHKTKFDQIKLKWDTHLGSLEGEFGKLKTEIRLAKQHLLQQMDLAEQSLLKTAGIAKTRKETAITSAKVSHEQKFSEIYQQINEKCQSLLRKLSNNNFGDEHVFQECQKLLNTLQEEIENFDKEDLLGINFTFVPSKTCFLGEVIAPRDADYILGSESEPSQSQETGQRPRKRIRTDVDTSPLIKQEHTDPSSTKNNRNVFSNGTNITGTSSSHVNTSNYDVSTENKQIPAGDVNIRGTSQLNPTLPSNSTPRPKSPKAPSQVTSPSSVSLNPIAKSGPAMPSLGRDNPSVPAVNPLQKCITVDQRCSGIVWVDNDWFFEVCTTKTFVAIRHHKISDRGQHYPNVNIQCNQNMEGVPIRVCPKLHSQSCSFVVAFSNKVAIVHLKEYKGAEVSWKKIPNDFSVLAISWRDVPSNYVALVRGSDGKIRLMRDISGNSGKPDYEVRDLPSVDFIRSHPFDISLNNEFAICNTLSDRIFYFCSLVEVGATKQVAGPPCLTYPKPISLMVRDNKKEWMALWKGKSPSDGRLKWAIIRYNNNFVPLATVAECLYANSHDEPKAFSAYGNKLAVLHNNLRIVFHHGLSTMSQ